MQVVLLFLAVLVAVGFVHMFSRACDRVIAGFGALFGGWRPDGWPRGVQEEDRQTPWMSGRQVTADKPEEPAPRPPLTPVRGAVHAH